MSDKMREEFEAWTVSFGLRIDSRDGIYFNENTHFAWKAWKASRAELCVELPKRFSDESKEFSSGFDIAVEHSMAALHEAGVRYK